MRSNFEKKTFNYFRNDTLTTGKWGYKYRETDIRSVF